VDYIYNMYSYVWYVICIRINLYIYTCVYTHL
jgi:hypothetical protein